MLYAEIIMNVKVILYCFKYRVMYRTENANKKFFNQSIFLIATEPLNRLLATGFRELMYSTEEGVVVGPLLYADDNLTPMALNEAEQLQPVLSLYDEYTGVSGLNINIAKTTALCINSPDQLCEGLR
jgi:hypothetical protein